MPLLAHEVPTWHFVWAKLAPFHCEILLLAISLVVASTYVKMRLPTGGTHLATPTLNHSQTRLCRRKCIMRQYAHKFGKGDKWDGLAFAVEASDFANVTALADVYCSRYGKGKAKTNVEAFLNTVNVNGLRLRENAHQAQEHSDGAALTWNRDRMFVYICVALGEEDKKLLNAAIAEGAKAKNALLDEYCEDAELFAEMTKWHAANAK
jgi:hypothetical protein